MPVMVDDLLAVSDDAFANFGISTLKCSGITATQVNESGLLDCEREVIHVCRLEGKSSLLNFVRDFGSRIQDGLADFLQHCAFCSFTNIVKSPLLW